jgi:hypothetical protein
MDQLQSLSRNAFTAGLGNVKTCQGMQQVQTIKAVFLIVSGSILDSLEIQCRRMDKQKSDAKSVEKIKSSLISSREEDLVRGRKRIDGLISAAIYGQVNKIIFFSMLVMLGDGHESINLDLDTHCEGFLLRN